MKITTIKRNETTGELYIDISKMLEGTNIDPCTVGSYSFEADRGWVKLALFDIEGNILEVKEKK